MWTGPAAAAVATPQLLVRSLSQSAALQARGVDGLDGVGLDSVGPFAGHRRQRKCYFIVLSLAALGTPARRTHPDPRGKPSGKPWQAFLLAEASQATQGLEEERVSVS